MKSIITPNVFFSIYWGFSRHVTKIQSTKLLIFLRFYFYDVLEQLKSSIYTNFLSEWVLDFAIDYPWISKLLLDVAFTSWPRELSCWLKVTYFGKIRHLNSSCIRKSIFLFLSSSRDTFTLFVVKLGEECFCWFPAPCWSPCGCAPAWRLQTNLYRFGKTFPRTSWENRCDLNLGGFVDLPFSSDSGLYLLNGFDFISIYFEWRDTEKQQLLALKQVIAIT